MRRSDPHLEFVALVLAAAGLALAIASLFLP